MTDSSATVDTQSGNLADNCNAKWYHDTVYLAVITAPQLELSSIPWMQLPSNGSSSGIWAQWRGVCCKWGAITSIYFRLCPLCVTLAHPFWGIGKEWAHTNTRHTVPRCLLGHIPSEPSCLLGQTAASRLFRHISSDPCLLGKQQPPHT